MILTQIYINRQSYGPRKGEYEGKVVFDDETGGSVTICAGHDLSAAVVRVCAESIKAQVQKTADAVTNSVAGLISAPASLEDQSASNG